MIFLLLLAQLVHPSAEWADSPVRHLHCPAGYVINHHAGITDKICRPFSPADRAYQFNSDTQELIYWGQVETIPASGKLRINYSPEFVTQPGCEVIDKTDEATNHVSFSDASKAGVTIHGTPGHKLHLNCRGIIEREKETQ